MGIRKYLISGAMGLALLAGCQDEEQNLPPSGDKCYYSNRVYQGTATNLKDESKLSYGFVDFRFDPDKRERDIIALIDLRGMDEPKREDRKRNLTGKVLGYLAWSGGANFNVYVMPNAQEVFKKQPKIKEEIEKNVFSPEHKWIYVEKDSREYKILTGVEGLPEDLLGKDPMKKRFTPPRISSGDSFFDRFEK